MYFAVTETNSMAWLVLQYLAYPANQNHCKGEMHLGPNQGARHEANTHGRLRGTMGDPPHLPAQLAGLPKPTDTRSMSQSEMEPSRPWL